MPISWGLSAALFLSCQIRQIIQSQARASDGRYNLADIKSIKEKRAHKAQRKEHRPPRKRLAPVMLDWLSPLDIPAILRLDQIVYNEMYLAEAQVYRILVKKLSARDGCI